MQDFRPETFLQFFRTNRPTWLIKIIWIGVGLLIIVQLVLIFSNQKSGNWSVILFLLIATYGLSSFYYSLTYTMYSYGRRAYLEMKHQNLTLLSDVSVWVRNYDLESKKNFFQIDYRMPIYHFNKADIILGDKSLILLGKSNEFGSVLYASPVEITGYIKQTTIAAAEILNWSEQKGRITIEIKDEFYNKPFKIDFKDQTELLKLWLTSAS